MKEILTNYDDTLDDVLDKVNSLLKSHQLEILWDDVENSDGVKLTIKKSVPKSKKLKGE